MEVEQSHMKRLVQILQTTCILMSFSVKAAPGDENWQTFPLPPGLDGPLSAMATVGKNLYVAGDFALAAKRNVLSAGGVFSRAGFVGATNVAVWNGRIWSSLGAGLGAACPDDGHGTVNALAIQGNSIYAGGVFHNSGSLRMTN